MLYSEIEQLRESLKSRTRPSGSKQIAPEINEILKGNNGTNKFITLFDYHAGKFVFHYKVTEFTGYTENEFTIPAINNSPQSQFQIIHPDDIEHKRRYDYLVLFNLMSMGVRITPLHDNYEIFMRIVTRNGETKRVNRQSFIYEVDEGGIPLSQLDIWKIIPNNTEYVSVGLNYEGWKDVYDVFYAKNRLFLEFNITNRQVEILTLKAKRHDNTAIADCLHISTKTVENHINILKHKMKEFCEFRCPSVQVKDLNDIIHFVKKWGIIYFDFN
ncbi:MAG: hypothetical protein HQ521_07010 [Bacteroidetes bacterium]|nr:hypothetical protein [Bacteroidota bacterium]